MKPRIQNLLVGAGLIAFLAWAAARQGSRCGSTGQGCGTGCLSLPVLSGSQWPSKTNGAITNSSFRPLSTTNLTPSPKQP